jgi:hypothetical protein
VDGFDVIVHQNLLEEALFAKRALVFAILFKVPNTMMAQVSQCWVLLKADIAGDLLRFGVYNHVMLQVALVEETLAASVAHVSAFAAMPALVVFKGSFA